MKIKKSFKEDDSEATVRAKIASSLKSQYSPLGPNNFEFVNITQKTVSVLGLSTECNYSVMKKLAGSPLHLCETDSWFSLDGSGRPRGRPKLSRVLSARYKFHQRSLIHHQYNHKSGRQPNYQHLTQLSKRGAQQYHRTKNIVQRGPPTQDIKAERIVGVNSITILFLNFPSFMVEPSERLRVHVS